MFPPPFILFTIVIHTGIRGFKYLFFLRHDVIRKTKFHLCTIPDFAFDSSRAKLLEEIISNGSGPVSKYTLVGDIEMPHSVLFAFPVYADNQLEAAEEYINTTIGGVHVKTMIITSIVLGSFCYRRFDKEHTNQYRLLVEEYRTYKPSVKTDYNALDSRQE